jgi:hypothetical protein
VAGADGSEGIRFGIEAAEAIGIYEPGCAVWPGEEKRALVAVAADRFVVGTEESCDPGWRSIRVLRARP